MALYINKITKEDYSASIGDMAGNDDYILIRHKNIIDRSSELPKVDRKYWKFEGDFFTEMTESEKATADTTELDLIKAKYIAQVNYDTSVAIDGGFEFEGDRYQSEEKDISNYQSLLLKSHLLGPTLEITLYDKSFKTFDTTKLTALTDAAFIHKATQLTINKAKVSAIRACTSVEELEAL